jgi:hypothetical protein
MGVMTSICSKNDNIINREVKLDLSVKKIISDRKEHKVNSFDNKVRIYIKKLFFLKLKIL